MFQSLRANSKFYILHKEENPRVEEGSVVSVTAPVPKYPMPTSFNQQTEMIVDVVVKVNDGNFTFQKLPANADIADFGNGGNVVVATSRDAINSELSAMKQRSMDVIKSVDYHKSVIAGCDKLLRDLNPEYAEKQKQQEEISILQKQMGEMSKNMADLMEMNRQLMQQLAATEGTGRTKKVETTKTE